MGYIDELTNTSTASEAIEALTNERAQLVREKQVRDSQAAERVAIRIRALVNPTAEEYSRVIREEYRQVEFPELSPRLNSLEEGETECPWCLQVGVSVQHIRGCSNYKPAYTEEELRDVYSSPTDAAKLEREVNQ